jgi:RNA polymerase sigma-70 factor (ECF subfamily)
MSFAKVIPLRVKTSPKVDGLGPGTPQLDSMPLSDEQQLRVQIDAAAGGDVQAAQALLLRVLPRVRNLIRYLVRGEDLDDLTQDALLKVLERLASFRGEGRFEAWVDGVTVRVTLRNMGKRRMDESRVSAALPDELAGQPGSRPSTRYVSRRRAVEALDQLPMPQRVTLVMHHVLGMTVSEISTELSAPAETIRSRLRIGMGQMRALLGLLREEEP